MQHILQHPDPARQAALSQAIQKIAADTRAESIYCFGHRSTQKRDWSPFRSNTDLDNTIPVNYYDLLLVMPDSDLRYQDTIDSIAYRPITAHTSFSYLAFTSFHFYTLLKNGDPFIHKIYHKAARLHSSGHQPVLLSDIPHPNPSAADTATLHWVREINTARQLHRAAGRAACHNRRLQALTCLEEAACHACIALIILYTGHQPAKQLLSVLLRCCDNFCTIRSRIFPCNTPEETALFQSLERTVVTAGPHHAEHVPAYTMDILLRRVDKMLELADWLYKKKTGAGACTLRQAQGDSQRTAIL